MSAPRKPGWFRRETWQMLGLLLGPDRGRVEDLYELLATHNNLATQSLYLNYGYWKDARGYDDACRALALRLGEKAGLRANERVLDAGFGFADQDMLWVERFDVARIDGVNLTPAQVRVARERVRERGLASRIELHQASATALPFDAACFDKVLALESAFHFRSREDFFREAHRVLRPGGRLALADMLPRAETPPAGLKAWLVDRIGRSFWQIPRENMYPAALYGKKLEEAGFSQVELEDISEHVFAPFKAYAQKREAEPDVVARANPLLRMAWRSTAKNAVPMSYVLVTATKPRVV